MQLLLKEIMDSGQFYSVIAGASTTNIFFLLLFGVLNYFRKRLNKSNCQSHCYVFDCEAQLDDLQKVKSEVTTQRGMLQSVLDLLGTNQRLSQMDLGTIQLSRLNQIREPLPERGVETINTPKIDTD